MDASMIPMVLSGIMGIVVTLTGYLVQRAVGRMDKRADDRQQEVKDDARLMQTTLSQVLSEARDTNHRITKLEAWQLYSRGQENPVTHKGE